MATPAGLRSRTRSDRPGLCPDMINRGKVHLSKAILLILRTLPFLRPASVPPSRHQSTAHCHLQLSTTMKSGEIAMETSPHGAGNPHAPPHPCPQEKKMTAAAAAKPPLCTMTSFLLSCFPRAPTRCRTLTFPHPIFPSACRDCTAAPAPKGPVGRPFSFAGWAAGCDRHRRVVSFHGQP